MPFVPASGQPLRVAATPLASWVLTGSLLLGGCGNISNRVFQKDADFVAAFPADSMTLSAPPGSDAEAPPALLALGIAVGTEVNDALATVLSAVDTIRAGPPASREDDSRTWGTDDWGGVDLSAAMSLTGGTRYDWSLTAAATPFASGGHYAGDTVAGGDGAFDWDAGQLGQATGQALSGHLDVTYDAREGMDLLIEEDGWSQGEDPVDALFAYTLATGTGDFQFASKVADPGGDGEDDAVVRLRWVENVGGRADAWLTGGSLAGEDVWTECWGPAGDVTYALDTLGLVTPVAGDGGEALCVLHGQSRPDRI